MIPTLFTGQLSGLREGGEGWREVWRAVTMSLVHLLTLFPPLGVLPIAFPLPQCCQSFTSYSDSVCFLLLSKLLRCLAHIDCPLLLLVQSKMEYQSRFLEAKPNFASTSPEMIQVLENNGTPFFATVPEEVAREIHATLLADCSSFLSGPPQGMTRRAQCVSGGR